MVTKTCDFKQFAMYVSALKQLKTVAHIYIYIQGVPGGKVNILGGHSLGHSKRKTLYEHASYSERFPR